MANVDLSSLKPNSSTYKTEKKKQKKPKKREKVDPIISKDKIVSTKKSFGRKLLNLFIDDSIKDVKGYLIKDVLIPGVKSTLLNALSLSFFGEFVNFDYLFNGRDSRNERWQNRKVNYSSRYKGPDDRHKDRKRPEKNYRDENKDVDYRDVVLDNRRDAENLANAMKDRIYDDGSVSIAEFFDMIELPSEWTDNDWGWVDERDISVRSVRNGFLIDVPKAIYLGD